MSSAPGLPPHDALALARVALGPRWAVRYHAASGEYSARLGDAAVFARSVGALIDAAAALVVPRARQPRVAGVEVALFKNKEGP